MRVKGFFPLAIASLLMTIALAACGGTGAQPVESAVDAAAAADAVEAAGYVPSIRASEHVGESVTVKGLVKDYQYHDGKKGKPTLILFDEAGVVERGSSISDMETPETFTLVVMRKDAPNFPPHYGQNWSGKVLCVTGTIEVYNGSPAMIVSDASNVVPDC